MPPPSAAVEFLEVLHKEDVILVTNNAQNTDSTKVINVSRLQPPRFSLVSNGASIGKEAGELSGGKVFPCVFVKGVCVGGVEEVGRLGGGKLEEWLKPHEYVSRLQPPRFSLVSNGASIGKEAGELSGGKVFPCVFVKGVCVGGVEEVGRLGGGKLEEWLKPHEYVSRLQPPRFSLVSNGASIGKEAGELSGGKVFPCVFVKGVCVGGVEEVGRLGGGKLEEWLKPHEYVSRLQPPRFSLVSNGASIGKEAGELSGGKVFPCVFVKGVCVGGVEEVGRLGGGKLEEWLKPHEYVSRLQPPRFSLVSNGASIGKEAGELSGGKVFPCVFVKGVCVGGVEEVGRLGGGKLEEWLKPHEYVSRLQPPRFSLVSNGASIGKEAGELSGGKVFPCVFVKGVCVGGVEEVGRLGGGKLEEWLKPHEYVSRLQPPRFSLVSNGASIGKEAGELSGGKVFPCVFVKGVCVGGVEEVGRLGGGKLEEWLKPHEYVSRLQPPRFSLVSNGASIGKEAGELSGGKVFPCVFVKGVCVGGVEEVGRLGGGKLEEWLKPHEYVSRLQPPRFSLVSNGASIGKEAGELSGGKVFPCVFVKGVCVGGVEEVGRLGGGKLEEWLKPHEYVSRLQPPRFSLVSNGASIGKEAGELSGGKVFPCVFVKGVCVGGVEEVGRLGGGKLEEWLKPHEYVSRLQPPRFSLVSNGASIGKEAGELSGGKVFPCVFVKGVCVGGVEEVGRLGGGKLEEWLKPHEYVSRLQPPRFSLVSNGASIGKEAGELSGGKVFPCVFVKGVCVGGVEEVGRLGGGKLEEWLKPHEYVSRLQPPRFSLVSNGASIGKEAGELSGGKVFPCVFVKGVCVGGVEEVGRLGGGKLEEWLKPHEYDLIVIGGGSGGLAAAKEAGKLGKKVAVLDLVKPTPLGTTWGLGGTCVNVGCIPKKLMHQASLIGKYIQDAKKFGWKVDDPGHEWASMVKGIQNHIGSLNWGHRVQLREKSVTYLNSYGSFIETHKIKAINNKGMEQVLSADRFLLSTGLRPRYVDIPGAKEYCITSDDIFSLKYNPGKTLCVGASYVSLECAGFLRGIGLDVTVMVRSILLRGFDQDMAERIGQHMASEGVKFIRGAVPICVEEIESGTPGKYRVTARTSDGEEITDEYNTVLLATGRDAVTDDLGLDIPGVDRNLKNKKVIGYNEQSVSAPWVFAIGDVLDGKPELTPVAIHAGKFLMRRLFGNSTIQTDYVNVPTTVFTPMEYGCCGLAEEDAIAKYGKDRITVFHNLFDPLEWTVPKRDLSLCYGKLICDNQDSMRVLGFHVLAPHAGEITQGFGIALKMKATKEDFDNLIGIHPTCAEVFTSMTIVKDDANELVTSGC